MASICPKCHEVLADEVVCCAEVRYTWKCDGCGKLTQGFVLPYGRCFLCGGNLAVSEGYVASDKAVLTQVIEEAVQYEVDMFHFYRLSKERTNDARLKAVFEELYHKEVEHLEELDQKYHVHLETDIKTLSESGDAAVAEWIFEGIDFDSDEHVLGLYDKAIAMERRTRDHFARRAEQLPAGPDREIYRELAAEEAEHVALLETERAQFED